MIMQSFYERLEKKEKEWVENIYKIKKFPISLDYITFDLFSQRLAFEKVMKKESFELVDNVSRNHEGNIAFLTLESSYFILEGLDDNYRFTHSSQFHNIGNTEFGDLLFIQNDLGLNHKPKIKTKNGDFMEFSSLISLLESSNTFDYDNKSFRRITFDILNTYHSIRYRMQHGAKGNDLISDNELGLN